MQILEWVKKQTGKLADNVKDYKFYVKNEPNFIDSSTTLILTPFTNRDEVCTVPCIYKWSRIKNGLLSQVSQFKGNSFICQPSDIGCIIQAQVTSTDNSHPGTAILKYGPVKLDVLIKKQVEHALTSGSSTMNVDLTQKDDAKECQVRITQQNIKITHFNSSNQYSFDYTLGQPRIQASAKQPNKIIIYFNQKYDASVTKFTNSLFGFQDLTESLKLSNQKKLELRFQNRALKDNFLLIVKAFNTKKAMKTSAIVGKLENINLSGDENFSYVLEIESLRADLIKLARLNDKYIADKRMCYEQNRKLEKQIQEIIVTYTKIVQGKCKTRDELDQSVMELRQKRDEVMEKKLHSLMRQNETLKDRIQYINEQLQSKNSQYIGEGGMIKNNSGVGEQLTQSRGGFIKKRTVPEVAVNQFDQILENLNQSKINNNEDPQKSLLAKKLNQSVVKIAKLEQKVKQMKLNNTALLMDNAHNISGMSDLSGSPNKKLNYTAMQLGSQQREKFCAQIQQLRKRNMKLKLQNENYKLKSQIPMISSQTQRINAGENQSQKSFLQDNKSQRSFVQDNKSQKSKVQDQKQQKSLVQDNKSQRSKQPGFDLNPELQKSFNNQLERQTQQDLSKKVQQLTTQNFRLKDEIQKLTIERDALLKEKIALQTKYKKKVGELSSQNSMYKRNQDALNRSQNLSMEMSSYNQQQLNFLKQQNQVLANENQRITKMYQKTMQEAKQIPKLKQQILKLSKELSSSRQYDTSIVQKSKNDISVDQKY